MTRAHALRAARLCAALIMLASMLTHAAHALEQIEGVRNVDVSLEQAQARIEYDPARVQEPALRSAISCGVEPSRKASPSFMGVFTPVGCSDTTRMWWGASSMAQDLESPVSPHLEAA